MTADALDSNVVAQLHDARLAEKRQALFYRALASAAEDANDAATAERLNELHADEQHHLSRLTVTLMELGEQVPDLGAEPMPAVDLGGWETLARGREAEEVARYAHLLTQPLGERLHAMVEEFLVAERGHEANLGGKWMIA